MPSLPEPEALPSKPKVLVLGATGKVGRLVVQKLLEQPSLGGGTIVAFVRDYDKACRVLYDDLILSRRAQGKTPSLQIVTGDLVSTDELPGSSDDSIQDDEAWRERAASAAKFYGNSVDSYDDGKAPDFSIMEQLEDAVRGATVVISCVGTVRPTNIWTDFLARPVLRVFHKDVSAWCEDPRHPYYVNYLTTRNVLALVEKEQLRREARLTMRGEDGKTQLVRRFPNVERIPSRIRFIRISDLCVSQQPWQLVPLLTNIVQSMVFRYQEMAEQLLHSSSIVDTTVIRPGDLMDDERNETTTNLHVDPSGTLPIPSYVGREDVASLVVAAALVRESNSTGEDYALLSHPSHRTLAVRWTEKSADSRRMSNESHISAAESLQAVIQNEKEWSTPQRLHIKPHGLFAGAAVYALTYLVLRAFLQALAPRILAYIPWSNRWRTAVAGFKLLCFSLWRLLAENYKCIRPAKTVTPRPIPF